MKKEKDEQMGEVKQMKKDRKKEKDKKREKRGKQMGKVRISGAIGKKIKRENKLEKRERDG